MFADQPFACVKVLHSFGFSIAGAKLIFIIDHFLPLHHVWLISAALYHEVVLVISDVINDIIIKLQ